MSNVVPSDYGVAQATQEAVQATPNMAEQAPYAQQIPPQDIVNDVSRNPGEPVTAGLPTGPGPGPEAIPPISPPPLQDDSRYLADYLQAMEHLIHGSTAGTSAALRIQARQIRANLPPEMFLGT
jgi:hypothetical protein